MEGCNEAPLKMRKKTNAQVNTWIQMCYTWWWDQFQPTFLLSIKDIYVNRRKNWHKRKLFVSTFFNALGNPEV